jgi:aryl-alcohol dehydrogenase-like predicted oxidoreductase
MKKISVNKNEYNLINNDERYSNLLNSLKARGITLVIKEMHQIHL